MRRRAQALAYPMGCVMRFGLLALATIVQVALFAAPVHAQWQPPIGIPQPAFGIVQLAPAAPSPWTTAVTGFYYVDATKAASTDTSNPYGTPAKPRKTIPNSLPAGSVVELHGAYTRAHTSPNGIVSNGTFANPVFIRGASAATAPLIQSVWELSGSYMILENLEFGPLNATQTGRLFMLAPLHHAALRHSNLHGTLDGGGLGVASWSAALTQHIVILDNSIHDNGNLQASDDQDVHGITVSARVSNLWVVDNRLYRNSGDGIQINAGSIASQATTHHIYVGRNTAYNNKQTGFWAKQAVDVIFSQNICYGHRPSNSSMGQCMGYQYATERAWFLYNDISDSEFGIAVSSDNDQGAGVDSAFIGNVIHNIHHSETSYNSGTAWSSAGIMLAGGTYASIVNNTIYDADAGINVPVVLGSLDVSSNIIGNITVAAANHLFIENPALVPHTSFHHNLLSGNPRMRTGGAQHALTAPELAALSSLSASPAFVDATMGNFRLQPTSPAIDRGETHPLYAAFLQRYGLNIALDADRTVRPSGGVMDLGAFEANGCGTPLAPAAPTGLTSTVSGQTTTFNWTAPGSCNVAANFLIEAGSAAGLKDLGWQRTIGNSPTFAAATPPAGTYYLRVKAENAIGMSAASNETVLVVGVPGTPSDLAGSAGGSSITLTWKAPTAGPAVTAYVVEAGIAPGRIDGSATVPGAALTFTGPAGVGTFYVRVRAVSGTIQGVASNEIALVVQ
jgi:hypothetical protein